MKRIILDTNFLLIPTQFKVDIFSEIEKIMDEPYKLCIVDTTIDELEKIKKTVSGKDKIAVNIALQLLKVKDVEYLKTEKHLNTDELILEIAKRSGFIVATQDMALKRRLKQNDTPLIVLRQKKYLKLI